MQTGSNRDQRCYLYPQARCRLCGLGEKCNLFAHRFPPAFQHGEEGGWSFPVATGEGTAVDELLKSHNKSNWPTIVF